MNFTCSLLFLFLFKILALESSLAAGDQTRHRQPARRRSSFAKSTNPYRARGRPLTPPLLPFIAKPRWKKFRSFAFVIIRGDESLHV